MFTLQLLMPFYIFSNCLLLFATFLYLPIFWRIKKHSHLLSAQINQPQKYVMWQLIVIIGLKISYIPLVLIFNYEKSIDERIHICETIDNFSTVLTIQLTYLGCSKRNLQCCLNFLSQKWYIRVFKCCKCCKKNRIDPMGNSEATVGNFTRY
ncbi:hypothetical protein B9Z55_021569 [Caenorhabditis nigoni]|uniref:G-protein coupled receptors family 1 profile domain-containing protein n=1 Tax=Caenorhabditis nigoni TaxID=1611254 RepID=A0A2G5TSP3_9PELO|nr:hypothetical protein B9Z55_021569 [Caenorhabditis nigoni]